MCDGPVSKWGKRLYLILCALCIVWAVVVSTP